MHYKIRGRKRPILYVMSVKFFLINRNYSCNVKLKLQRDSKYDSRDKKRGKKENTCDMFDFHWEIMETQGE